MGFFPLGMTLVFTDREIHKWMVPNTRYLLEILPMFLYDPWADTRFYRQRNPQVDGTKSQILSHTFDSLHWNFLLHLYSNSPTGYSSPITLFPIKISNHIWFIYGDLENNFLMRPVDYPAQNLARNLINHNSEDG